MPYSHDPNRFPTTMRKIGDLCEAQRTEIRLALGSAQRAIRYRNLWYAYVRAHEHALRTLRDYIFKYGKQNPTETENARMRIQELTTRLEFLKDYQCRIELSDFLLYSLASIPDEADIHAQLDAIGAPASVPSRDAYFIPQAATPDLGVPLDALLTTSQHTFTPCIDTADDPNASERCMSCGRPRHDSLHKS